MATPAPRFTLALFGTFAAAALLLALVGIYGVVSFITSQRTQEIGIRMALGANRRQVMWMALRQTLLLALVGVAAGLPAGLWCRTAGPGRADSNPAARSMGAHCRHLHSAAAGCRRIVPAGATGGQHQSRSNSARRVARRHWKSLPVRIERRLKMPVLYPEPPHSLRALASRYARINQSSAERPGSVTANAVCDWSMLLCQTRAHMYERGLVDVAADPYLVSSSDHLSKLILSHKTYGSE